MNRADIIQAVLMYKKDKDYLTVAEATELAINLVAIADARWETKYKDLQEQYAFLRENCDILTAKVIRHGS